MVDYQGLEFVGIIELIEEIPYYHYCNFNILQSEGIMGHLNIEGLGKSIAHQFGDNFRQKITYEPPEGIHKGKSLKRYHPLSVLEKDRFERAVLNALKGREGGK